MAPSLLLIALLSGQDAPTATTDAASVPAPAPIVSQAEFTPEGAPKDDYQFTAWCRGVLEGHMALADRVQSVLPLDEVQTKVGKAYLKGYDEALETGKAGRGSADIQAAANARIAARSNWDRAMAADLQLAADTYLAWQLPGRCEHAAKRVAGRDDLFRMDGDSGETLSSSAGAVSVPVADIQPAPVETAAGDPGFTNIVPTIERDLPPEAQVEQPVSFAGSVDLPTSEPAPVGVAPAPVEPEPAVAAQVAPAAAPATDSNGQVINMPSKGRLLPWGKKK